MDVDHSENIPLPDTEHTPSTHDPLPKSYLPVPANISDIKYEFAVMDWFINVKLQKICQYKVTDEYFGNDKLHKLRLTLLYVSHSSH